MLERLLQFPHDWLHFDYKIGRRKNKNGLQKLRTVDIVLTLTFTILIIDTVDVDGDIYETQK